MKRYKQPEIIERIRPRSRGTPRRTGQKEDVHGSGVYPASGPWPKGEAPVRSPADWNERKSPGAKEAKPKKKGTAPSKARTIAQRGVERASRKIKSEFDEAYHRQ